MVTGKLVILRHGETPFNAEHLMTGQREVPLTARGEEQADEAGIKFSVIVFDHAYSSKLSRAFNTAVRGLKASATNDHLKKPDGTWRVKQDAALNEQHTGEFTGRCHKTDPEILAFRRDYHQPLPGGESDAQVVGRVQKFFDAEVLPKLKAGENVLVVCHAGVVRAFDVVLGREPVPQPGQKRLARKVPNATPEVYEYEDGVLSRFYPLAAPPANTNTPPRRTGAPKI